MEQSPPSAPSHEVQTASERFVSEMSTIPLRAASMLPSHMLEKIIVIDFHIPFWWH